MMSAVRAASSSGVLAILTLRRTMLAEHAAGEAFRHAERLPCALNAGATAGGA